MPLWAKAWLALGLKLLCVFGFFLGLMMGGLTMYGDNPAFLLIGPVFLIGSAIGLIATNRWYKRIVREETEASQKKV